MTPLAHTLHLLLAVVATALVACRPGDKAEQPPPQEDDRASVEPEPERGEAPTETTREPTPVPDYLLAVHKEIERGHVMLALKAADGLLEKYPADPWVLADVGFAKGYFKRKYGDEGDLLLARALELARNPSLRARILNYQARLVQGREGFTKGRRLLVEALAEFPLPSVQRNLDLIDGTQGEAQLATAGEAKSECDERMFGHGDDKKGDYRTCVGVAVGDTTWVRVTTIKDESSASLEVFHEWHIVDPAPLEFPRLQFQHSDGTQDHDLPGCEGSEVLSIDSSYGGEGEVLMAEVHEVGSDRFLIVRCRRDEPLELEGFATGDRISEYVRACRLDYGWCNEAIYAYRTFYDGTVERAEIELKGDRFVVTKAGGTPQSHLLRP